MGSRLSVYFYTRVEKILLVLFCLSKMRIATIREHAAIPAPSVVELRHVTKHKPALRSPYPTSPDSLLKVGIMEVDSEHMRKRLMPSPVQCLNAIKVAAHHFIFSVQNAF